MGTQRRTTRKTQTQKRKTKRRSVKTIKYYDYSLLAILICLICFGLVMLYSTSAYSAMIKYGDSMHYFKRQLIFSLIGLCGMYVVLKIHYRWYYKRAKAIYMLSLILMALVQTPLGKEVNGARRWLRLPAGLTLQPSEVAKIAVILFIPVLICQMGKQIKPLAGVMRILMWGGAAAASGDRKRRQGHPVYLHPPQQRRRPGHRDLGLCRRSPT